MSTSTGKSSKQNIAGKTKESVNEDVSNIIEHGVVEDMHQDDQEFREQFHY
jgi:hypothetical protein